MNVPEPDLLRTEALGRGKSPLLAAIGEALRCAPAGPRQ